MYSIAIDGPSSAGKSTVAKEVAKKLSFIYVDTGAMYRATAIYFSRNNVKKEDENTISSRLKEVNIELRYENGVQQVLLNNENVTSLLRSEEMGQFSSIISTYAAVRKYLVSLQQEIGKKNNIVMDGRDIGTVVLPDANLKIFLTADVDIRAERRCLELQAKGLNKTFDEVKEDLIVRDERDQNRKESPLKKADDAILLDSSFLSVEEVCEKILNLWNSKMKCEE